MPAITATAPGKVILFGEHAVVYGRPAIAVPVQSVRARAVVMADIHGPSGRIHIQAPDINLEADYDQLPLDHPLRVTIHLLLSELGVKKPPACRLRVSSTIPIASGMGSGAAITIASIRGITAFLGTSLLDERVSAITYEVEKLYHGTPSGIDNTVIAYQQPVYFQKKSQGNRIEVLPVGKPFQLIIGDTGIPSSTAKAVGDLRVAWQQDKATYERLFDQVGEIVDRARQLIERGETDKLGELMNENHVLLQKLGVSSEELDRLVEAARQSGAAGAKLSGAGRGGNMVALPPPGRIAQVASGLKKAGAVRLVETSVA